MKKILILLALFFIILNKSFSQGAFNDATRALYIMDISRYIEYPEEIMMPAEEFSIGVLSAEDNLYWELENLAKTRKFIQGKPIRVYLYRDLDHLDKNMVLYVNKDEGFKINNILNAVKGKHTLLITEGYEFRESMINFKILNNKPRFEVNEALLNKEGLKVDELFLALAIKTREDWQELFQVTEVELVEEKVITQAQRVKIEEQQAKIDEQLALIALQEARLDSLDKEVQKKQNDIRQKQRILSHQLSEINKQKDVIRTAESSIKEKDIVLAEKQKNISIKEKRLSQQENQIAAQDAKIYLQFKQLEKQKLITYFISIALFLVIGLLYFIYLNYKNKKKANLILEEKNRLITEQKEFITEQRDLAEMQRDQIAYQKKHITDSIHYAKRIQTALLPSIELFSDKIDHFVLYKPRDIVSGDFYWVNEIDGKQIIITADCTGHGVPGAFMSMLGISLLNEIVNNKKIHKPNEILNTLRKDIIDSLKQSEGELIEGAVKDGMDMTACTVYYENDVLEFSGANNPLYIISGEELIQIKGDKMPVAIHALMDPFSLQEYKLKKGDCFYTFSDGFVDQFGGPNQKKFLSKNFRELLLNIKDMPMVEQGNKLDAAFEKWRADVEQVDDVTVIGVKY
jgi:serine phosphatase RsbU (regulator of sigma subunit)